jgi:hypothetical protein
LALAQHREGRPGWERRLVGAGGAVQRQVDKPLGQFVADRFAGQQQPAVTRKPVSEWGSQQGMHVTGSATPYDFLRSTTAMCTRKISDRIRADVLLLAGADDHYVPLSQLVRQAGNLTNARSVTTRAFTAAERASNHCQLGNIGAVSRLIDTWLDSTADSVLDGNAAARTPTPM